MMNSMRFASRNMVRSSRTCASTRRTFQTPRSVHLSGLATKSTKLFTTGAREGLRTTTKFHLGIKSSIKRNFAADAAGAAKAGGKETAKKTKTAGDIFLDNIGTVFLSAIGLLILTLIRSSYGTSNKTSLRQRIEVETVLDPFEIDDLRTANDELTPEIFREIYVTLRKLHGWSLSQKVDYKEFVSAVMQIMKGMKGDAFTIQLGHLIDRVVTSLAETNQEEEVNMLGEDGLEFSLLLVVLTLAMKGTVRDRVEILYTLLQDGSETQQNDMGGEETKAPAVKEKDIVRMVGYLQKTCQLVPDSQIVESDVKYPIQEYKIGSPFELVHIGKEMKKEELSADALAGGEMEWTCDDVHHLLRSRGVCAWGECYVKKKSLID